MCHYGIVCRDSGVPFILELIMRELSIGEVVKIGNEVYTVGNDHELILRPSEKELQKYKVVITLKATIGGKNFCGGDPALEDAMVKSEAALKTHLKNIYASPDDFLVEGTWFTSWNEVSLSVIKK